jgi:small subunit ribosomal protein S3
MGIPVHISIEEIRKPELDAQLVAEGIAQQLERRIMFRRAMKRAVQNTMRARCPRHQGQYRRSSERRRDRALRVVPRGRVPLHTLRADIDYGFAEARTTYGIIGVKTWIFRGEVFGDRPEEKEASAPAAPRGKDD